MAPLAGGSGRGASAPAEDPLALLPALRPLDGDALAALVRDRRVPLRGVTGLIDLSEELRSPASVARAVDELGWRWQRRALAGGRPELERAAELLLAVPGEDGPELLPEVRAALEEALAEDGGPAADAGAEASGIADAHAAEAAFGHLVLAAEVLRALDESPRAAREDREGPRLAGADARRIASALDSSAELVAALARLAVRAGLAAPADGALRPTEAGRAWLDAPMPERWRALAEAWLSALRPAERRELLADGAGLEAAALGVVGDGRPSSAGRLALDDRLDEAAAAMAVAFPQPVDQVYLQPDCSIIAPGPLRPDLDERLREIADLEQHGLAARYRLSAASIHRALAHGATPSGILADLEALSISEVPQPVAYLVEETGARYGAVRVRRLADPFARGCRILADDPRLLDAIEIDRSLSALGLARVEEHALAARSTAEGAYWSLLEARYPVAAEDADGTRIVIRRRRTASPASAPAPSAGAEKLAQALLDDPARADDADGGEALLRRRLEQARRDKAPVRLRVDLGDGSRVLELVPTSATGPRFRGRDVQADVERTLPFSAILGIEA
ncbi:hypothetical protein USB125703_00279 [Pseudoclavibacter triregionum]|nr:hypothetical protein USB125703_00279 [Pseudoclavibacter triregionum]